MATRQDFCDVMNKIYENHGVYIGTGNGEYTEKLTIEQIIDMEIAYGYDNDKTHKNIARDLRFIAKCIEQGFDMRRSIAGDCSGIIVAGLRMIGAISESADYNCRSFQDRCKEVPLEDLQAGDLLFNKKKKSGEKSTASHMAMFDGSHVIESKGRDAGVVRRLLKETNFIIGGRLDWFDDSIPVLTRNLYYREGNLMRGEDVKQCQEQLTLKGFPCGSIDKVFGKKSRDSVLAFQKANKLEVDGVVGQRTWAVLFS